MIVVEIDDAIGVFEEGGNVRGDEVFLFFGIDANDDWGTAAGGDDFVLAFLKDDDGVAAVDFFASELDGGFEVVGFGEFGDEVGDYFTVAVGFEGVAFVLENFFVFEVVFEDTVVNEDDLAVVAGVRVGVFELWFAVCGPTGMAEREVCLRELLEVFEVADFADFFVQFDVVWGFEGDAPRVVAAIF